MAATGYTPIQLYYSATSSAVPVNTNLLNGELAINITDGKLFYKDNGGVVQVIATKGSGTIGGTDTQVQFNDGGSLGGSSGFTYNKSTTTATISTLNLTNALGVAYGGTGLTSGTSGGVLYYSATGTLASSGLLSANSLIVGGGAGVAPSTITTGTGVVTALGVNTGSAGSFVVDGGALGTPASGTLTNVSGLPIDGGTTGTLPVTRGGSGQTTYTDGQLLIGNSVGNTLTKATLTQGTGVTITNGNGSITISATGTGGTVTSVGMTVPTFLSVSPSSITTSGTFAVTLSGTALPVANGGTGLTSGTSGGVLYYSATGTLASSAALTANAIVLGGGAGAAPATTTTGTGVVTAIGNSVNTTGGLVTQSGTLAASAFVLGGGSGSAVSSTTTGTGVVTAVGNNVNTTGGLVTQSGTLASSALLLGGGSGSAITSTTTGTGVVTALGNNANSTGGFATINGTATLTNKRIDPRVSSTTSTASITPDISSFDQYAVTAQAATLAINAPIGTPVDGNKLIFRILDNGVSQTLSWNGTYTVIGVTLPTTTTAGKMTYVGCIYNVANTRWDVIAVTTQA